MLGAALDDPAILACGLDELASFPDVVRDRFFDVDILARLAGPDPGKRVPVVAGRDHRCVDAFVVKHLAHIGAGAGVGICLGRLLDCLAIGVAQPGDLDPGQRAEPLDRRHAAAAHADEPDPDPVVGAKNASPGPGQRQCG